MKKRNAILLAFFLLSFLPRSSQAQHQLRVEGIKFYLDETPFPYTGISFFNAIFNEEFNSSSEKRKEWLQRLKKYGINVLRVWSQWDNPRGFVDSCPDCSLFDSQGTLRPIYEERLHGILKDCDDLEMVVELVIFSHESLPIYEAMGTEAADQAVRNIAAAFKAHRNLSLQIWNEHSDKVLDFVNIIREADPERLVTNSPGFAGVLGDTRQNLALDYLTPHTSRQNIERNWEVGPEEIGYLIAKYRKPVVDDEPARNGTSNFGGPRQPTSPFDHLAQIFAVWQKGGYVTYHHDMFQLGKGHPTIPPSGIPDPEFNPYHLEVFKLLAERERYMK